MFSIGKKNYGFSQWRPNRIVFHCFYSYLTEPCLTNVLDHIIPNDSTAFRNQLHLGVLLFPVSCNVPCMYCAGTRQSDPLHPPHLGDPSAAEPAGGRRRPVMPNLAHSGAESGGRPPAPHRQPPTTTKRQFRLSVPSHSTRVGPEAADGGPSVASADDERTSERVGV